MGRALLLRHMRRNGRAFLLGSLSLILVNLADVSLPLVLKLAIDDVVLLGGWLPLVWIAGAYMGLSALLATYRYLWRRYFFGASHRIANGMRAELFAHLERLPPRFYDHARTGDLMSRATNDLEAVRWFSSLGLLLGLDTCMYLLLIPPAMVSLSGSLTAWALLPLVPMPWIVYRLGRVIHARYRRVQASFGELSSAVEEFCGGIRVIKGFAQEPHFLERFRERNLAYRDENMRLQLVHGVLQPSMSVLMGLATAIVFVKGGHMALAGAISVGDFVAFQVLLLKLGWPMRAIGFVVNLYQRGTASLARIAGVLATPAEIADGADTDHAPARVEGHIEVRDLTFRYPGADTPALEHIALEIPPGATVAVVGPVGAGKSTLLELLVRLYDPPPETLLLDGRCVRRWPIARLRRAIGYVPQETFLFADTVEANVTLGLEGVGRETVREALARAQLLDEIEQLPDGLDTVIGERGVDLSGGQRQRLAIARAIVRRPAVLLLDDCLSAVDAETEAAILEGLREAIADCTAVLATHRLQVVRNADAIVVLEHGRVVEHGRHEQLLARGGVYAGMWRRQQLEHELEIG
ncbi:MAG: ABC transporter ATP-binding protein [Planctomycetota bacterium]|nr:MAG: ABC transporter ATP-binding protein [Planctomycetota bacterium]